MNYSIGLTGLLALAASVSVLAGVGCGDSDGSSGTGGSGSGGDATTTSTTTSSTTTSSTTTSSTTTTTTTTTGGSGTGGAGTGGAAPAFDPDLFYTLKSEFRGDGECLEGNDATNANAEHGGASFMTPCDAGTATGQQWMIEEVDPGVYTLKTLFRGPDECLESNDATNANAEHGGASFMSSCTVPATGQRWEITSI